MIEVVTFHPNGSRLDTAEADSPEAAVIAARTMYDDVYPLILCRTIRFYVDGKMIREIEGRP